MTESKVIALEQQPRTARHRRSAVMLMLLCLLLAIVAAGLGRGRISPTTTMARLPIATVIVGADRCCCSIACGFYMLQPNQAAAITLFGDYRGHRPDDRPALGPAVDDRARKSRSAPTISFPSGSRSTTCAATRSRWRRRSSGAWSTPRRPCSTSTITSSSSGSRSRRRSAPSARATPMTISSISKSRCAAIMTRSAPSFARS